MTCRVTQDALRSYVQFAERGRVIVFDTETTGISNADEIIQLAAAEYVCGKLEHTLDLYMIPSCPIHPEAEAVHHITMPFLVEHGMKPCEALAKFFDFLGGNVLLVGHNIRFDFRMLQNSCRKHDFEFLPSEVSFCDTIAFAKKTVPGLDHYRLGYLIEALGLTGTNSHNALDDALACGELFFDLVRRVPICADDYTYEPVFD